MRYELTDKERTAINPMLPNKPRGVPRVNDRCVLNGILLVLRSGAPWRDLLNNFGPYRTCYNRFALWRLAGVCAKIMSAVAGAHDIAVQMIDTSIVRVHQHASWITWNRRQSMGRSRGELTGKIHALVDANGLDRLAVMPGEGDDNQLVSKLLSRLKTGSMLLADRGYDADWIREFAVTKAPGRTSRRRATGTIRSASARISTARNRVERFFNKIKHCPGVATRYVNSPPTTLHLSNLRQSGCGSAKMSPRPNKASRRFPVLRR